MPKMTAPNGAVVEVADDKVDTMVRHGYTAEKKAPAKKAAAKSSDK